LGLRALEDGSLREVRNRPPPGLLAHGRGGPEESCGLLRPFDGRCKHGQVGEGSGDVFPDFGVPPKLETFAVDRCRIAIIAALHGQQAKVAKRNGEPPVVTGRSLQRHGLLAHPGGPFDVALAPGGDP
jgi:hypothetical protein